MKLLQYEVEEMSNGLRREYGFDYDFAFWKPRMIGY